jgi:phosphopantethiene--protein transferase domain
MMKVGIDTVEISRIEKLYLKEKKAFLDRVFTKKEKEAILELEKIKSKQLYSKIAGKYAVKEALYKAFGRRHQI